MRKWLLGLPAIPPVLWEWAGLQRLFISADLIEPGRHFSGVDGIRDVGPKRPGSGCFSGPRICSITSVLKFGEEGCFTWPRPFAERPSRAQFWRQSKKVIDLARNKNRDSFPCKRCYRLRKRSGIMFLLFFFVLLFFCFFRPHASLYKLRVTEAWVQLHNAKSPGDDEIGINFAGGHDYWEQRAICGEGHSGSWDEVMVYQCLLHSWIYGSIRTGNRRDWGAG